MPQLPDTKPAHTILVVDDNEANRVLARETLEDEDFRVLLAVGGSEGIRLFEQEQPDCILLDVQMPDLDGFAVCQRIRALPGGAETPVIFLTALRDVATFDRALYAGGDDFLAKPVRPAELLARVQTALKLRSMRTELTEHYALLKKQRDDLMRLQLLKERLIAFVVHDLKNPVHSMDLGAQLLLRDNTLNTNARETITQIRAEAQYLNRMILNLLDLAKADEGKLVAKRTQIALDDVVSEVFTDLGKAAHLRQVTLEKSFAVKHIVGDTDLLRRMIANLVENAIRHAPAETVVTFSTVRVDGATELRVRDAGTGVAPESRETIFDAFKQLESHAQPASRHGRGLGLSFCKVVVEAHHGRIWVEDGAPGAIFCATIPDDG